MPGFALIYLVVGLLTAAVFCHAAMEATGESFGWDYMPVVLVSIVAWPYLLWRVIVELENQ